jgi:hypothetical protein
VLAGLQAVIGGEVDYDVHKSLLGLGDGEQRYSALVDVFEAGYASGEVEEAVD